MIIFGKAVVSSMSKTSVIQNVRLKLNTLCNTKNCESKLFCTNNKFNTYDQFLIQNRIFSTSCCVANLSKNNDTKEIQKSENFCEKLVKSSGLLEPYLKLIRLHKPTGGWLLFWPFGWSIALAANPGYLPDIHCLLMFCTMAFIMRGAGCTINDMWDKEIDKKVLRTKDRPLAQEKITRFDALVFLGGQLGVGCLILLQYNFYTIILSASSLVLAVTYPLMKKLIPWPQVILGMAMNYGTILGSPAVHGYSDWSVCLPLYLGGICWTVVYDTIYAYQDINDDKKLGLKSTAIVFSSNPRLWLGGFSAGMISFMTICGYMNSQAWPYYASLFVISAHLAKQLCNLNTNDAEECAKKFVSNQRIGLVLFLGIVFGNLVKSKSMNDNLKYLTSSQDLVTG